MRDEVRAGWQKWNDPFEGTVYTMYADIEGLVTVGVGNLIDPIGAALGLPFVRKDGARATREEIATEWHRVKDDPSFARLGWTAAAKGATLRLTPEGVAALVAAKLEQMGAFLGQRFPEFEAWPWQAQQATLSMSWAAGPSFSAPRFSAAVRAWDWATAAKECHLDDSHNPGLVPRNVANRALFEAADRQDRPTEPEIVAADDQPIFLIPDMPGDPPPDAA